MTHNIVGEHSQPPSLVTAHSCGRFRMSMECSELGINIATREQVGGDNGDDGIEWVIISANFFE